MTIEELKNEAIQKANELTEQMLKEHEKMMNDLKKEYDEKIAKLQEEPKTGRRWKPEKGEKYYYISGVGIISGESWDNEAFDLKTYSIGNVFKTKEEAEFMVEKLKVLAELKEYADDEQEWDGKKRHWHIFYNYDCPNQPIYCDYNTDIKRSIPYFSSSEQAQRAIDSIGEERLKKYYFEVEEQK